MKKAFIILSIVCASLIALTSCDNNGGSGGGNSTSGYAPSSIPAGQVLSGASLYFNFGPGPGKISINSAAQSLGYIRFEGTPTLTYRKTSANSATVSWSATIYNDGRWSIGDHTPYTSTYSGNVTLFFISPNEGYASGTSDGRTISDEHFTLL